MNAEGTELLRRWRAAMTQLSVVTEAPAAKALDESVQITGSTKGDSAPKRADEALVDKHRRSMERWVLDCRRDGRRTVDPNLDRLRKLVAEAEYDLEHVRHRTPNRRLETTNERDARVLREYEGVHYIDAAEREVCSPSWVRTIRERNGRCALDGLAVSSG